MNTRRTHVSIAFLIALGYALFASFATAQPNVAPKKYALLVAVNQYEDDFLNHPPLKYPEADAQALKEELARSEYVVEMLVGSQATRDAIISKLKQLNSKGNTEGCVVIGFFGHGVEFESSKEAMFIPYDSTRRLAIDLDGKQLFDQDGINSKLTEPDPKSLVGMSEILDNLGLCKAGNKLLLADCCRKNPNASRGVRAFGSTLKLSDLPNNTAAIFACAEGEEAQEDDAWSHGAMTKGLLELLPELSREDADIGSITGRLRKRVSSLVSESSKGNKRQTVHPIVNGVVNLKLNAIPPANELLEFTNSLGMVMKLIPPGQFQMGSASSELSDGYTYEGNLSDSRQEFYPLPREVVIAKSFYMGATEVTRGQFRKFVTSTGYRTEAERGRGVDRWASGVQIVKDYDDYPNIVCDVNYNWLKPGFEQTDAHPVVNVSWNDAIAFCEWLSTVDGRRYHLPTEEQWEYACRGKSIKLAKFCFGNDSEKLIEFGNVLDGKFTEKYPAPFLKYKKLKGIDGHVYTAPCGIFRGNEFGIKDMHGNVSEWCNDVYTPQESWYEWKDGEEVLKTTSKSRSDIDTSKKVPIDKDAEFGSRRVRRGGSWVDDPVGCRSAARYAGSPHYGHCFLGFRVSAVHAGK